MATSQPEDDVDHRPYRMESSPKGICLIIHNEHFARNEQNKGLAHREGSEKDKSALEKVFTDLEFEVECHDDQTSKQMMEVVDAARRDPRLETVDCFFCCIMTHGKKDHVFGSDGLPVAIKDMTSLFKPSYCPQLTGKPKIFVIQACQGETRTHLGYKEQPDATNVTVVADLIPDESDFLIGYSTVPGYVSWRNPGTGSRYIQCLAHCLEKYAASHHLVDIHTLVHQRVAKLGKETRKQASTMSSTFRKRLYLAPTPSPTVTTIGADSSKKTEPKKSKPDPVRPTQITKRLGAMSMSGSGDIKSLLQASRDGQVDKVKDILSTKPDIINYTDEKGRTALDWASEKGHRDVVKVLLDKGADINKQNEAGWTALITASGYGHRDVVELLLERKADFNICNVNGSGPLYVGAEHGHADCVRSLLSHGAPCDIRTTETYGSTPLTIAAKNGREEVVTALLQHGADVDMSDNGGTTPLFFASQERHDKIVNLLVEKKADVNKAHNDGRTPLFMAACEGHVSVVSSLLSHDNIDINKANNNGSTPLIMASQEGKVDVVRLLLDAKAEVDRKNKNGATPLSMAAQQGHTEVVKLLLQHRADPNSRDDNLSTPLTIASWNGHEDVVRALLDSKADVSLKDKWDDTALDSARKKTHTGIVNMLQQRMK